MEVETKCIARSQGLSGIDDLPFKVAYISVLESNFIYILRKSDGVRTATLVCEGSPLSEDKVTTIVRDYYKRNKSKWINK